MSFCTVINCMDGRVQLPVIRYLQERFGTTYVDSITEPGPVRILASGDNAAQVDAILDRVRISMDQHKSIGIAVVGHHDCTGNPTPHRRQLVQIEDSIRLLRGHYPDAPVLGLWVDHDGEVHEIPCDGESG